MATNLSATVLDSLLDKAVNIPSNRARARVAKLRARHPKASPEQLVKMLESDFLFRSKFSGAGVGAAAAVPTVGTAVALGLTAAQMGTFLASIAYHVMAVAEVYGIPLENKEQRRTLLLTAILGEEGANTVQTSLGLSTVHWARQALTNLPASTVKSVNATLRKRAAKTAATRGGLTMVGRLAPFGIGAAVGWTAGKAMANTALDAIRAAFGPAPSSWAATDTIDADGSSRVGQLPA